MDRKAKDDELRFSDLLSEDHPLYTGGSKETVKDKSGVTGPAGVTGSAYKEYIGVDLAKAEGSGVSISDLGSGYTTTYADHSTSIGAGSVAFETTYNLCELLNGKRFHLITCSSYSEALDSSKLEKYSCRTLFVEKCGSGGDVIETYPVCWDGDEEREQFEQNLVDIRNNLEFLLAGTSKTYRRLVLDAVIGNM